MRVRDIFTLSPKYSIHFSKKCNLIIFLNMNKSRQKKATITITQVQHARIIPQYNQI